MKRTIFLMLAVLLSALSASAIEFTKNGLRYYIEIYRKQQHCVCYL